ncbi:MAG: hypothetical protein II752_05705, partial [Muribaculaceae bacterium]|nr:hypothetical protein [Muribaculaceae bacterium]
YSLYRFFNVLFSASGPVFEPKAVAKLLLSPKLTKFFDKKIQKNFYFSAKTPPQATKRAFL